MQYLLTASQRYAVGHFGAAGSHLVVRKHDAPQSGSLHSLQLEAGGHELPAMVPQKNPSSTGPLVVVVLDSLAEQPRSRVRRRTRIAVNQA